MNIKLSEKAKVALGDYAKEGKDVKVKVTGYTWCGAKLGIVLEKQNEKDEIVVVDGIQIILSEEIIGAMSGIDIDYKSSLFGKSFEVTMIK